MKEVCCKNYHSHCESVNLSESNKNQNNPEDNDHANFPAAVTIQAKSSDHSQSVFDEVEDRNCEEETD